jgi:CRP-like cAMP-binding protein
MSGAEYAAVFAEKAGGAAKTADDTLVLPQWGQREWTRLLSYTAVQPFRASEVVIQRGGADRALYFVAAGTLEVGITQVDGVSIASLAKIHAGSIIGEQSFFDGQPRSANVWAESEGALLKLDYDAFLAFSEAEPALARDLLFALARVLSLRLRNTTYRVRR